MWQFGSSIIDRVRTDTRGAAMTEYSILLGTVALGSALAFITVGVAVARDFAIVRNFVLVPFP
jgi:Flp pilus assembly pilin Flp